MGERKRNFCNKKVENMEIVCHFYPIDCYICLLGFWFFTVVDCP